MTRLQTVKGLIKLAPFVVNFAYIIIGIWSLFDVDNIMLAALDAVAYQSVLSTLLLLALSYACGLCAWHRICVILPLWCSITAAICDIAGVEQLAAVTATLMCMIVLTIVATIRVWATSGARKT